MTHDIVRMAPVNGLVVLTYPLLPATVRTTGAQYHRHTKELVNACHISTGLTRGIQVNGQTHHTQGCCAINKAGPDNVMTTAWKQCPGGSLPL